MSAILELTLRSLTRALGAPPGPHDLVRLEPAAAGRWRCALERGGSIDWYEIEPPSARRIRVDEDERLPRAHRIDHEARSAGAKLLSWIPGRRASWRLDAGAPPRVIKAYRRRRSTPAADRHRHVAGSLRSGGFRVPRLLAHDAELNSLELELVPGSAPLLGEESPALLFRVGHGLRRLQEDVPADSLPAHGPAEELAVLDGMAHRLAPVAGRPGDEWIALRATLAERVPTRAPSAPACAHRDLHDGQLLVGGNGLALLDFDLACRADPLIDAANLSAHLSLRALQGLRGATERSVQHAAEALLEGLDRGAEAGFAERLRFYQGTSFLRLALVYSARPRWRGVVPELVGLAGECVRALR